MLSPESQRRQQGLSAFARETSTSTLSRFRLLRVLRQSDGSRLVDTSFVSEQEARYGRNGQTCSTWELRYRIVLLGGGWRIDNADLLADTRSCA